MFEMRSTYILMFVENIFIGVTLGSWWAWSWSLATNIVLKILDTLTVYRPPPALRSEAWHKLDPTYQ